MSRLLRRNLHFSRSILSGIVSFIGSLQSGRPVDNILDNKLFDLLLKLTIDFYFAAGLHSIVLYGTEPPTEVSDNASGVPVDVSLWIGLLVALVVFILAFLFIVKMMLRKKRLPASGYTLTTSGGMRKLIWNLA